MDCKQAILDSITQGELTPEFVDWVWRIGLQLLKERPWARLIDYEGVIQDTLIHYLNLEKLPSNYDQPQHYLSKHIKHALARAFYLHRLAIGNLDLLADLKPNQRRKKRSGTRSKWKGVSYYKRHRNWRARFWIDGKEKLVGYYLTEEEAGRAYLAAEKAYQATEGRQLSGAHEKRSRFGYKLDTEALVQ